MSEQAAAYGSQGLRTLRIEIPGEPHAQQRQRHRLVKTKSGREFVHGFQPQKSINWKAVAQGHFHAEMLAAGLRPFDGPVRLVIVAYFPCPRSEWRKREPRPERPSMASKDWDNVGKSVSDAGSGVLYLDDRQVVDARVVKRIAAQGEPARVVVFVSEFYEADVSSLRESGNTLSQPRVFPNSIQP